MSKPTQQGFDVLATRLRLEDWWLEHFVFPAGLGLPLWPGGRSESIRAMLFAHWSRPQRGVERGIERGGAQRHAPHCFDVSLAALGVALALLEIDAYDAGCVELEELAWLKQAEHAGSISASIRTQLLSLAHQIAAAPVSRAAGSRTAGRPKRMLAQAMAQHLWAGGFSQSEIAKFMTSTVKVVASRCKVKGARSLAAAVV